MNKIILTADGSNTLYNETIGEHYHSKHGAVQESLHVFIDAGLKKAIQNNPDQAIALLEIGFGTGLNYLLSLAYCLENNITLKYTGIEAFPISQEELLLTNYGQYVPAAVWENVTHNYQKAIGNPVVLFESQEMEIAHTTLTAFQSNKRFDVIYFDAFSVQHQPEMWTEEILAHTCNFLKTGGIFVTYAITGNLKRALKKAGMTIEKLPGAPGKREMLRAYKI
ncbi:tRNA (5-methylaminomethyl-2-thiouridine)(34)-methyltransferase MnmD [Pedobacter immunditicola]|uniref:tRNA (5-methylaminomethyl-2-thiouridine)(34)-methyltransferase MnmD n=1 Tax=Pedobacter immunditicola TaxID=3133440 RepID=UPI0030A4F444